MIVDLPSHKAQCRAYAKSKLLGTFRSIGGADGVASLTHDQLPILNMFIAQSWKLWDDNPPLRTFHFRSLQQHARVASTEAEVLMLKQFAKRAFHQKPWPDFGLPTCHLELRARIDCMFETANCLQAWIVPDYLQMSRKHGPKIEASSATDDVTIAKFLVN